MLSRDRISPNRRLLCYRPAGRTLGEMVAWTGNAIRIIVGAVFLACAAMLGFVFGRQHQPATPEHGPTEVVANTASVVTAVRGLARLETVAYHMERIIDVKNRIPYLFGLIQADDAILLVAAGDVVAGIDLSKMTDGDITVIAEPGVRRVRMRLPAPEILSVRLDNERTYVHSRRTDLLAARGEQLESRARQFAERGIRDAALEAGILSRSRQGAEQTLLTLARSLGYQQAEFEWGSEQRTAQ